MNSQNRPRSPTAAQLSSSYIDNQLYIDEIVHHKNLHIQMKMMTNLTPEPHKKHNLFQNKTYHFLLLQ